MGKTVSVIIPLYNGSKYIKEAINSVVNQTYPDIELIVINDGSTDSSEEIVLSMEDELRKRFIKFIYLYQDNGGVAKVMNRGISLSSGDYIVSLAQDDIQEQYMIEKLISVVKEIDDETCMVCGDAIFIDENSKKIYLKPHIEPEKVEKSFEEKEGFFGSFIDFTTFGRGKPVEEFFGKYESLLMGNYIPINASIIKKEALKKVGMFTEGNFIEDWDLWLKLSKKYKFYLLKEPLLKYRWHSSNSSKKNRTKLLISSLETLINEYNFAKEHGYLREWSISFMNHINLLKNSLNDKKLISYLNKIQFSDLTKTRKVLNKLKKEILLKKRNIRCLGIQ